MGLTHLDIDIGNPANPAKTETLQFLVDSGATYSVVPRATLERLGVRPHSEQRFRLANGDVITRERGVALFKYGGRMGGADVVFGEEGDSLLLGAMTLEALGFGLDPIKRELIELPMLM